MLLGNRKKEQVKKALPRKSRRTRKVMKGELSYSSSSLDSYRPQYETKPKVQEEIKISMICSHCRLDNHTRATRPDLLRERAKSDQERSTGPKKPHISTQVQFKRANSAIILNSNNKNINNNKKKNTERAKNKNASWHIP